MRRSKRLHRLDLPDGREALRFAYGSVHTKQRQS